MTPQSMVKSDKLTFLSGIWSPAARPAQGGGFRTTLRTRRFYPQIRWETQITKASVPDEWRKLPLCQNTKRQGQQPADNAQGSRSVCE